MLIDAAGTAQTGDLTAAARRLALLARELPDFDSRDELSALLPTIEPATAPVPAQRHPSTVDTSSAVRLRLGPGVPDAALLHPRPLDLAPRVGMPVLILAGGDDVIVGAAESARLRDAFAGPAELVTVEGAGHADVFEAGGPGLIRRVSAFLGDVVGAQAKRA